MSTPYTFPFILMNSNSLPRKENLVHESTSHGGPCACSTRAESPSLEVVDERGAAEPGTTAAALPQFKGSVLLVEDDEVLGPLTKLMLERLGLKVDLVTDGGQALETAGAMRYDLVFMDCWMPVMGGVDATRKLRSSPEMACWKTPVVALTGNATKADAAECREAGMNDFMSKPILFDGLITILHKFLPTANVVLEEITLTGGYN